MPLSGPGVIFGAALLAVLVYYTFPYTWSWVECLLFGAIASATDPVAVVAVLKEVSLHDPSRVTVNWFFSTMHSRHMYCTVAKALKAFSKLLLFCSTSLF